MGWVGAGGPVYHYRGRDAVFRLAGLIHVGRRSTVGLILGFVVVMQKPVNYRTRPRSGGDDEITLGGWTDDDLPGNRGGMSITSDLGESNPAGASWRGLGVQAIVSYAAAGPGSSPLPDRTSVNLTPDRQIRLPAVAYSTWMQIAFIAILLRRLAYDGS
jgi:hypothetical protein